MTAPLINIQSPDSDVAQLAESVQAFVRDKTDHRRTRALRDSPSGFERELVDQMAALGWTSILVPVAYGGLDLGVAAMAAVAKELGRGLMNEPLVSSIVLAGTALAQGDNPGLQASVLPDVAAGQMLPSLAWQEAADGSDALNPDRPSTRADSAAPGARLSGRKRWIGGAADAYIVSARSADGLALYWIRKDAAGLRVEVQRQLDGSVLRTLVLENAESTALVAGPGTAGSALAIAVDTAATVACAEMCGIMEFAMETTLEYMRTRVQYDRPIGSFQALQHKAVDLYVQQELALSATLDAITALDGESDRHTAMRQVSRAKARCSEAGVRIAREAIQLHGAVGFTDEYDIGLYLKRALVLAASCGGAEQHRQRHAALHN